MNEIKFRAWDIEAKEMRHIITDLHFALHGLVMCRWMDSGTLDDHPLVNDADCVGGKDRFILMQFTGLKDKNDKEIYEGDIVKIKPMYLGFVNGLICWNNSHASYQVEALDTRWLFDGIESFEIIGNIHQNPKLLEQDNA